MNRKVYEAVAEVARLCTAREALYEEMMAESAETAERDDDGTVRSIEFDNSKNARYLKLCHQVETLSAECATDAELRAAMEPWQVEFEGADDCNSEARTVLAAFLQHHHFSITESDFDRRTNRWYVHVACSDNRSQQLCRLAREKLPAYFEARVITMGIQFLGWRFTIISNEEQTGDFLKSTAS